MKLLTLYASQGPAYFNVYPLPLLFCIVGVIQLVLKVSYTKVVPSDLKELKETNVILQPNLKLWGAKLNSLLRKQVVAVDKTRPEPLI